MLSPNPDPSLSNQPVVKHLRRFDRIQSFMLTMVVAIAGTISLGWLAPWMGAVLPDGWSLMKADTAFCMLVCAFGLHLTRQRGSFLAVLSAAAGVFVVIIAATALIRYLGPDWFWSYPWSPEGMTDPASGRMSISTALYFVVAGLALATWRPQRSGAIALSDLFVLLVLAQTLIVVGSYVYGAWTLVVTADGILTSPQTKLAMMALTIALLIRQSQGGIFRLTLAMGIGSSFIRIALPWAIMAPFGIVLFSSVLVSQGNLSPQLAAALTASFFSMLALAALFVVGRKLNRLESDLRTASLSDALTGVHNRRGFELLGEQRFHEAGRLGEDVALLYFDLDGLKLVNDRHGHDIGSDFIKTFADLLSRNFRHSDVVGRIGGDEFAVLLRDKDDAMACLKRLEGLAAQINASKEKSYDLRYSAGIAYASPRQGDSLDDLIGRADAEMYHHKKSKRTPKELLSEMAVQHS